MAMIQMPHPRIQVLKRSEGRSAVAAASYRSGEKLRDERLEKEFDYGRKQDILHTEIMAPAGSPAWAMDREQLWNTVEASENRKDSQPAREFMGVLPRDLSHDQHVKLVRSFVEKEFVSEGMVTDLAFHTGSASDGGKNPHVHIMMTMRQIDGDEFASKKNRDWNKRQNVKQWRTSWAEHINDALAESGSDDYVDFRSYKEIGINQAPTHHMGPHAWAMENRYGIETRVGYENKRIEHHNEVRKMTDALGLGQHDPTQLAANQIRQASSELASQHHDQPMDVEKRDHIQQVRRIAKASDPELWQDPAKRMRWMAQIEAWETDYQEQLELNEEDFSLAHEDTTAGKWSGFISKDESGQGLDNDEPRR